MLRETVTCPKCGKVTAKKKRCMYCYAILPPDEQGVMGGTGSPYWQSK